MAVSMAAHLSRGDIVQQPPLIRPLVPGLSSCCCEILQLSAYCHTRLRLPYFGTSTRNCCPLPIIKVTSKDVGSEQAVSLGHESMEESDSSLQLLR
jgi:hypothetical protein